MAPQTLSLLVLHSSIPLSAEDIKLSLEIHTDKDMIENDATANTDRVGLKNMRVENLSIYC